MMRIVIYILAGHTVEATAFAAQVMGIPVRQQGQQAVCITDLEQVPRRFMAGDVVRATPMFWGAMDHVAMSEKAQGSWTLPSRRRLLESASSASIIATAVRMRGGVIEPPYDVPVDMSRETIEEWLAE